MNRLGRFPGAMREIRRLDLATWPRRRHYEFFKNFEQPFFNVCTEVEVTALVDHAAETGRSFFLSTLFLSLRAANEVEELRMRLRGEEVVVHPLIHGGSTVLRDDETFGFGYFDYGGAYDEFEKTGRRTLERVRKTETLDDEAGRDDLIFYSVLPWVAFTSFAHARACPTTECNPRIVFGKRTRRADGSHQLPISIEVHHALVDGIHVGRFLERFQELVREPRHGLES